MLDLLLSRLSKGEEVLFSEHKELLSVQEGVERPEESRGSQFQPSSETHLESWAMPLWTLELGERGLYLQLSPLWESQS